MTIDTAGPRAADRARLQLRFQWVLLISVIPTVAAMTGSFSSVTLLAEDMTGSGTLAGLAAGGLAVGNMIATLPLARYMARRGRRRGLVAGWSVGAAGAAMSFVAAVAGFYPLLVAGIVAVGTGNSTNLATRYAAADLALPERRARAIGMLMWGSTFGAVLGPIVALGPAGDAVEALGLPALAGPYLLALVLFLAGLTVTNLWLRPDPLEVLGTVAAAGSADTVSGPNEVRSEQRANRHDRRTDRAGRADRDRGADQAGRIPVIAVLGRIAVRPPAALAALAMLTGHTVMVGIMTMTPLHMKAGAHGLRIIGFVISLHVVGMYAFSPAVGWLVDRLGPHLMIASGGVVLFAGAELAGRTDAADSTGVFIGLLLVGLGWSFGLIAGSSLLTNSFPASQRVEVQGTADFLMAAGAAAAGLPSGAIFGWAGYHSLSRWAGMGSLILVAAAAGAFALARSTRANAT